MGLADVSRHTVLVLFDERLAVSAPEFSEGAAISEEVYQPGRMRFEQIVVGSVDGHQEMPITAGETFDPVFGRTRAGVAKRRRPLDGTLDKRLERSEREFGNHGRQLQRVDARPGDADVEPVVHGARRFRRYGRCGRRRYLERISLVPAHHATQSSPGRGGIAHLEQEVPGDRHRVAAQDHPLNVVQIECVHRDCAPVVGAR
ncbi:MAG: hypothetical protein R2845_00795 [Thermomicrobiales bacterium]